MMNIVTALIVVAALTTIGWPAISAETGGQVRTDQEQSSPRMQEVLEQMHTMRQQMTSIHAAEDTDERHRLTHVHMQSMRDAMMKLDTMAEMPLQRGAENGACTGHS